MHCIRMWKPANMFACFTVFVVWVMFLSVVLVLGHETCKNLIFSKVAISLKTVCILSPLTVRQFCRFRSWFLNFRGIALICRGVHTHTYRTPLDTCTKVISMTSVLWRAWRLYWIQFPTGALIFVLSQLISLISSRPRVSRICDEINVSC
jgi:hypothetical protein